jgi:hypothetical protein
MIFGTTIGVSEAELIGRAYNLRDPHDIEGAYSAASAGVAVRAVQGWCSFRTGAAWSCG